MILCYGNTSRAVGQVIGVRSQHTRQPPTTNANFAPLPRMYTRVGFGGLGICYFGYDYQAFCVGFRIRSIRDLVEN